jgi:hypothetical protein
MGDFEATPAFSFTCQVCGDRFVGGAPDVDPDTDKWMGRHAKWHQSTVVCPPPAIVTAK